MSFVALGALCFGILVVAFSALWLLSLAKRDASIVDAFWGPAFSLVAVAGLLIAPSPRGVLVQVLVLIWGLRLGLHLFVRNHGRSEDYRYAQMRTSQGLRFWWVSFFTVFLLQAALVLIVSLPILAVFAKGAPRAIGAVDVLAAALVLLGICIEASADLQLDRFRRDPANRGKVMDRGLWRYSRHPNYFGDAMVWWGFALIGVASGSLFSALGPLLMTFLLLKVSGVALLEKTIAERRPAYAEYIARTSAFLPWPPDAGNRRKA